MHACHAGCMRAIFACRGHLARSRARWTRLDLQKKALAHNRVNQRRRQVVLGGCAYASLCGQFSQECDEPAEVLESVDALLSLEPEVASVEELPPR